MKKDLKVIPLGGVEEIGINCTAIEYNDQILVIDAGLGFPLNDQYGIDYVIPNIDYLKKNKDKLEGIIITHGHLDHIGALPYILKDLDFPEVYATKFAIDLIKKNLQEKDLLTKAKIVNITADSRLSSGEMEINFFRVNHSIPESMGVIVRTPAGNIVHTGDFKFDNSPVNEPPADYDKISKAGSEGVLALLSDSTNSFKRGHSKSESMIADSLGDIIESAEGRVVVATFSSLVTRLAQLVEIAQRCNRKVAIMGRSMENTVKIARKYGFIDAPDDLFVEGRNINRHKDTNIMVMATGAQGEDMAALARMTRGKHRDFDIKKGDTVILSASVIPGNDMLVQTLVDDLSLKGAHVYHNADDMDLHSSGHGFQQDQMLMLNLVKPKYFIPVHGYQSFLFKHGQTAQKTGVPEKNVIIPKRGEVIHLSEKEWKIKGKVRSYPILVSGSGIGDIGNKVLNDRQQLAHNGVIIIVAHLDVKAKKLRTEPYINTKGFIYEKDSQDTLDSIINITKSTLEKNANMFDNIHGLKEKLTSVIRKEMYNLTERSPMVIPIFVTD